MSATITTGLAVPGTPLATTAILLMNGEALTMALVMAQWAIHGVVRTTVPASQVHSAIMVAVHGTMDGAAVSVCLMVMAVLT